MTETSSPVAKLLLRLYVIAGAPNSIAARANLTSILSAIGQDSFELEVVDCTADPKRALAEGVLVTPTLVRAAPGPAQTIIGSLSDRSLVTSALGLKPEHENGDG